MEIEQKHLILTVLRELEADNSASPKIAFNLHQNFRNLMNFTGSVKDVIEILEHHWEGE